MDLGFLLDQVVLEFDPCRRDTRAHHPREDAPVLTKALRAPAPRVANAATALGRTAPDGCVTSSPIP
jgi:hypothetical protein